MANPDTASARRLAGKCFCGAVHYAVPDEFLYAMNCHCSNCRRTTGSAFKPFAGIERHKLQVTKGVSDLMIFGEEKANDTHCKRCGSLLYSVVRAGASRVATRAFAIPCPASTSRMSFMIVSIAGHPE